MGWSGVDYLWGWVFISGWTIPLRFWFYQSMHCLCWHVLSLCYGLENALALVLSVWIQPQMQFPLLSSKISLQSTLAALSLYQLCTSTSLQFFSFFFVKRLQLCQVAWRSWALGHKFSVQISVMDVQRVFDSDEKQTCVRNTALWLLSLCLFSLKAIRQWYDCSFILVRGKTQWKVHHNCKTNRSWMHWKTVRTAEKVWPSAVCLHQLGERRELTAHSSCAAGLFQSVLLHSCI